LIGGGAAMEDYRTIRTKLDAIGKQFGHRATSTPFKGVNFITNRVVGRWVKNGVYFELSYGDFLGKWMFGVTFSTPAGDKSSACFTFDEVRELLSNTLNGGQ